MTRRLILFIALRTADEQQRWERACAEIAYTLESSAPLMIDTAKLEEITRVPSLRGFGEYVPFLDRPGHADESLDRFIQDPRRGNDIKEFGATLWGVIIGPDPGDIPEQGAALHDWSQTVDTILHAHGFTPDKPEIEN